MNKLLLLTILLLPVGALSQNVEITPINIIYKRSVPAFAGRDTADVTRPLIKAKNHALKKEIEKAIGFDNLIGLGNNGLLDNDWLDSAGYSVGYNNHGILSITITTTGTGASETAISRSVVIDTRTGEQITAAHAFRDLEGLAALVSGYHAEEVEAAKSEILAQDDFPVDYSIRFLENSRFTVGNLEGFSVGKDGVTFFYDYGFPRYIRALQPAGIFLITWKQLKPFLRRGGLLKKELVH